MPQEIFDAEKFLEIAGRASECQIKRLEEVVKLKLRTSRRLYTIKLPRREAEALLNKIKCEKVEV
ncbi:MAG: 50S ribosomal protein L38e [Candidatus Bathyarchaeia archaeon]